MSDTLRIAAAASFGWTVLSLAAQYVQARGGGRSDLGARAGSPWRGLVYNFTAAMTPAHKESVRLHPVEFGVGLLLHLGVFFAVARAAALIAAPAVPTGPAALGVLPGLSLLAGLTLFVRRLAAADLRAMSSPDDYLSLLLTCALLAGAQAFQTGLLSAAGFLAVAAVFFLYLPLGKLRHALFFFVARADYGRRLGYRGVYPAPREGGR